MADNTKTAVRNVAPGVRGLNLVTGYRDFDPNEYAESVELSAAELASAKRTNYFRFGAAAKQDPRAAPAEPAEAPAAPPAAPSGEGQTDELDKMSDDDLRATTAALTGKTVKELEKTNREQLLKLARGE